MYYIEQVEGNKVEAGKELFTAVKAGDFDTARAIFKAETGQEAVNGNESLWWIYNADLRVRCSHHIPAKEFRQIWDYYKNEYARALAMAKAAERIHGGRWQVQFEY